jgi:hypothetical protein
MKKSITDIIEMATKLDGRVLSDYLYEEQKKSDLSSKVFFGMLTAEINEIKKRDVKLINQLDYKGLIISYKYHLVNILVESMFEQTFSERELTPKLAKVLGYILPVDPLKSDEMGIMDKYVKEDDEWQKVEFDKTMNSLKPTFEKNGWYAPRDFREVREWHYYEIKKNPPEREDLPERAMIQDREIYIQWAKATHQKKETAPPAENIEKKFNKMPIEEVRKHLKLLIQKENPTIKKIWMTEGDFEIFMKRSFGGQTELSKPKINIGSTGKYAVVKLFYQFYSKSTDHPYNGDRKKDPFVKLLKDAFENSDFDDLTNDNFKGDKHKYEWV